MDELVSVFKYQGDVTMAAVLVELMVREVLRWLEQTPRPDVLVPMPMHWRRQLGRGYNQAALLTHALCRHPLLQSYRLHAEYRWCQRRRASPPQQGLGRRQRLANLDGVFRCNERVAGRHVVIVDDVFTTGASVERLAVALVAAGAARVDAWCCARTPLPCKA